MWTNDKKYVKIQICGYRKTCFPVVDTSYSRIYFRCRFFLFETWFCLFISHCHIWTDTAVLGQARNIYSWVFSWSTVQLTLPANSSEIFPAFWKYDLLPIFFFLRLHSWKMLLRLCVNAKRFAIICFLFCSSFFRRCARKGQANVFLLMCHHLLPRKSVTRIGLVSLNKLAKVFVSALFILSFVYTSMACYWL